MDSNKHTGFLIVDDVSINNFIVNEMLQRYDAPVDTAESAAEAIGKIKSGKVYDIIFMDHMMPDMNGTEATQIIRSMGYTGCIIALTANVPEGNERMYEESGFDRYIAKPIDPGELDEVINEFAHMNAVNANASDLTGMEEFFIMDAEHAIDVLEELTSELAGAERPQGAGMFSAITAEQTDTLEITMHGIKSAFRNIGNEELSNVAYKLEMAAKSGDTGAMDAGIPEFLEQLKKTVKGMKGG